MSLQVTFTTSIPNSAEAYESVMEYKQMWKTQRANERSSFEYCYPEGSLQVEQARSHDEEICALDYALDNMAYKRKCVCVVLDGQKQLQGFAIFWLAALKNTQITIEGMAFKPNTQAKVEEMRKAFIKMAEDFVLQETNPKFDRRIVNIRFQNTDLLQIAQRMGFTLLAEGGQKNVLQKVLQPLQKHKKPKFPLREKIQKLGFHAYLGMLWTKATCYARIFSKIMHDAAEAAVSR